MAKQTILVVDDSSTIRNIIGRELKEAGYEVIPAENGMEALAILEWSETLPDLITLDIDMPVMGGFEVCEKIRQTSPEQGKNTQLNEIPIVFVSANDSHENRKRGYELEVIDFISKPFKAGDIIKAVDNTLNPQVQFSDMVALVVDDAAPVRRIVINSLKRNGLTVYEAEDGESALAMVEKGEIDFDIIITDQLMPGMDGKELCKRLRSIEKTKNLPIFFISGIDDKDEILGFFKVGASDYLPKPFIEEELRARIITHLRNRTYVKDLEKLNDKLKFQAEHDALTALHNRRYFQAKFNEHYARAAKRGGQLACLLLDIDFFKKVNDNYGHDFGDLVLVEFAKILAAQRRTGDIAARYGGEEFIMLLPDTDLETSRSLAEQLRTATESHLFSDGKSELRVTISTGIATLQDHSPDRPDNLLALADQALYKAKENGRNRVEVSALNNPSKDKVLNNYKKISLKPRGTRSG